MYISIYRDIPNNRTVPKDGIVDLDESIKAISHPVRRDILQWLKDPAGNFPDQAHPHEFGVCAGQIDQRVGLSQSTVSTHLAILQRAGLVTCRKVGQWSFFQRDETAIHAFLQAMNARI